MTSGFIIIGLLVTIFIVSAIKLTRRLDQKRQRSAWDNLTQSRTCHEQCFSPALLNGLPDAARRYFQFTIKPGAPLYFISEITLEGKISLGSRDKPDYLPMQAHQILAPPHGLVWKLSAGQGFIRFNGSDGIHDDHSWSRFWLWGIFPIVWVGGNKDHLRSAFGRVVAESVFWAPATLLPQNNVTWREIDKDTAQATVIFGDNQQAVNISVADNGMPTKVVIPRWSNANPNKTYQLQAFGGYLSEFREFSGYRLPTVVEGGNFIDTANYFPFYKARVVDLKFIDTKR